MKEEPIWKVGPVKRRIHRRLQEILRLVEQSPDLYLNSTLSGKANIRKQDWDLTDKDEFFACMTEEDFANLTPSDPLDDMEPYEATESPDSEPPYTVFDLERSAIKIELWFKELQRRKVSEDGCGCAWPDNSSAWVPREKFRFEDLYGGSRMSPSVPWRLFSAYYNDDKPHQIYHAWHGDEGREGAILRSELQILIRCMKGRMADSALSVHNVPVLLLSIHGHKARIMIAHFNIDTYELEVKCSRFEQFDGFEAQEYKGNTVGRVRPRDFEAKRDLFFRWLNPTCQGHTFLEDSKDAPKLVLRGPKGRKRLVPR